MTTEETDEAQQLAALARKFRAAESTTEQRRIELAAAIRAAAGRSEPPKRLGPTAIARLTGYTREQVRRIANGQ
ncbi:hypothetical protein [Glycomyces sp. NPDC021274]|uniref:hypothetical protein n=1 Tax=Glycomyces sp. NPDC021274 TaxID=3155120 RepID=UPI0033C74F38